MDRMLVIVFDNEVKAYEGKKALLQLDNEGSISVYAYAVLAKHADGTATVKQGDDSGSLGTLVGTSLGSLIGLLGGPAGLAIGAAAGFGVGGAADLNNARIGEDFIDDVSKMLLPNRVAVVAEIEEDWVTPVDTRMEAIGGTVFRRALSDVKKTVDNEEVAGMKADFAQLKAEHAKAHADHKAKLQEKINQLDSKIQVQLQKAKDRREAAERQAQVKAWAASSIRNDSEGDEPWLHRNQFEVCFCLPLWCCVWEQLGPQACRQMERRTKKCKWGRRSLTS
jgi:uncharacterized membrane protein